MVGEGYNQPGTPWVSYYNGGEALHGVPAYMWGEHPIYVQQGIPGSHGCINMQVADAKWMYDFATIGTRVVVDGTTPTSGQTLRPAGADATGWQAATPADSICLIDNGKSPTLVGRGFFVGTNR